MRKRFTATFAFLLLATSIAQATVVTEGGFYPEDQNDWATSWRICAGYGTENGTITATDETLATKWLYLGDPVGIEGILNLNNSTWSVSDRDANPVGVRVGGSGTGFLNLTDGSSLDSYAGTIAVGSGSTGTATISGSTWTVSLRETGGEGGQVKVGSEGSGNLIINQGGVVNNTEGLVGYTSSGIGVVTVDGSDSQWNNSGNLQIGWNGNGTLNILNGATVSNVEGYLGNNVSSATGAVTVSNGSHWENSSSLMVGYLGQSSLLIENGGVVTAAYSRIGRNSTSHGDVVVTGEGSEWLMQWSLMVGQYGTGTLEISDGGLVSVGSTLTIDNNDTDECFLRMSTGGMLALYDSEDAFSGSLTDFLSGGVLGNSDALLFWDESESDWMPMSTASPSDYTLQHITEGYGAGYTVLTVESLSTPLAGDANNDGKVDGSDVTILAGNWQAGVGDPNPQTVTWGMGDFNGDGQIDGSDVTILAGNWQAGVSASAASVPEPSMVILLLSVIASLLYFRKC